MKIPLTFLSALLLAACANHAPIKEASSSHTTKVEYTTAYSTKTKVKTIKVKCHLPAQPDALKKPIPMESPKVLIDRLTIKLVEWVDYGAKVKKVC